jgi:dTDP-glucose 4,6-dehydratase
MLEYKKMPKNLLVTGGCGFIGTNFIKFVFEKTKFDGNLINVDCLTYAANPEYLNDIEKRYKKRYKFIKANINDYDDMVKIFKKYKIDTICHLAAESHVDNSIKTPNTFINTNILGTHNLLQISKQFISQIQKFHHVSTDEVFGSLDDYGYFTEKSQYNPNSPYSASKAAADHLVRAYYKTYELPITISNCSNNYGPYQFPEKLISALEKN